MHMSWLRRGVLTESAGITAMSLFNRYCAWRRTHPMSGGVMRVLRDRVNDYRELRKEVFGYDLAPLPRSLRLSPAENELNRGINPRVRASSPGLFGLPHPPSLIRSSSVAEPG
jgi:hypothetical protein